MARFIKSATQVSQIALDDKMVEFCFIGRSNAGKSSLINALANAKIAKTSKQPGRTQLINIYDFGQYRIVDLPGYGYAQVSKDRKYDINNMIVDYMSNRENLFCVFQICDIQNITPLDISVHSNVVKKFANVYVLLNKADKVNKSYFDNNKQKIAKLLNTTIDFLIPVSAMKKINMAYTKQIMNNFVKKLK